MTYASFGRVSHGLIELTNCANCPILLCKIDAEAALSNPTKGRIVTAEAPILSAYYNTYSLYMITRFFKPQVIARSEATKEDRVIAKPREAGLKQSFFLDCFASLAMTQKKTLPCCCYSTCKSYDIIYRNSYGKKHHTQ